MLGESSRECHGKVVDVNRSLVKARRRRLEYVRALHELLLVSILMCGRKGRSTIRAVRMDKLMGFLRTNIINKIPNERLRELCSGKK